MTPLQKVAMGLVIVLVDAPFAGYDGVPDPLGWLLVVAGTLQLRTELADGRALTMVAGLCLLVSASTYPPVVANALPDSGGWALSLPQLAFAIVLCNVLADRTGDLGGRFRALRWAFVVLAVGPVVVLGGGVDELRSPLAFLSVAVNVYLVYLLFRVHDRVPAPTAPAEPPSP